MRVHRCTSLVLFVLATTSDAGADPVVFEVVLHRASALRIATEGPLDFVIRSEDRWCEVWNRAHWSSPAPPPCDPERIDFGSQVAIGATTEGGTCAGRRIERIEHTERGGLRVHVSDLAYLCCKPAYEYPVQVVAVADAAQAIEFVHAPAVVECLAPVEDPPVGFWLREWNGPRP